MEEYQKGHRERLRQRFIETGFTGFSDREILEYFLCLCIPRKDVKPIAADLLKKFGSISKVIDQPIDELKNINGIGEAAATNISALRDFFGIYFSDKSKSSKEQITKMSSLVEMLRANIGHKANEVLFAAFLNAKNEVLLTKELGEGTVSQASAFPRKIVEEALKAKATSLILAHNHPGGIAEPSDSDIAITQEIKKAIALVDISMQDHIILADDNYYSFKKKQFAMINPKSPATLYTLKEILDDRFFKIPDYQRGYSWEEAQLQDLIKDIQNLVGKDYVHFTGTIVAWPIEKNGNTFDIVDGQQRLTSLIILLSELWRQNQDREKFEAIWTEYIHRGSLGNFKLVLESNFETADYFYNSIIKNEDLPCEIKSHECIAVAKSFFRNWLNSNTNMHELILDAALNKLGFIFFTPSNEKELGIMFEVINNRGKRLSELEKVKNYFIYYATVHGFQSLRQDINIAWKDIQRFLNQARITSNEAENDFLRNCLIIVFDARKSASHYAYDNLKERFNINESDQNKKNTAIERMSAFIDFLKYSSKHIAYLNNRSFFETNYNGLSKKELGEILIRIRSMPSKASILPLYLSAMMRWNEEQNKARVIDILIILEVLNFRVYVVPGISSRADSGQGTTFSLAHTFYQNRNWKSTDKPNEPWLTSSWETLIIGDAFDWLRTELIEFVSDKCHDRQLIQALTIDNSEAIDFYGWGQGIRYFLANYEEELWVNQKRGWDIDQILRTREELGKERTNDYLSIEHIWASNNRSEDFPHNEMEKRRLGNFVLLGMGFNSSLKDIDIEDKINAMNDWNSQRKGAITLFQVGELKGLIEEANKYLEEKKGWQRKTKFFYKELAKKLCDIRETKLLEFALRRWAVPGVKSDIIFEEINSFDTEKLEHHYIIHEKNKIMNDNSEKELPLGLYWKGKRTTVDRIVLPFQSLEVIETINESRATREKEKGSMFRQDPNAIDVEWRNKLIWGDNKYVMSALLEKYAGKIDLIYIDPPFATGANFNTTVTIGDNEIEHTKEASAMEELAYRDTWGKGLDSFLQMMYDRLVLMRELLSEKGVIYVHVDWRVSHYLKLLLDEIFGVDNFRNEIVWHYEKWTSPSSTSFQKNHDIIFFYSKSKSTKFNIQKDITDNLKEKYEKGYLFGGGGGSEGLVVYDETNPKVKELIASGKYKVVYAKAEGKPLSDVWKIPFINPVAHERLDYPTQKPEALIERIIKGSSNEGDLVADFFCGSGTTAAVAEKLGRRWITSDIGRYAIHTARKRYLEIEECKPFEILNIGKYERQYWQTINFGNKTAEQTLGEYVTFVLKLYKAEALPGSPYIHGKKGNKLVHVGGVEAPVTLSDIQNALEDTRRMKQKELVVLGWEWEMGLHDVVEQEAEKAGIKLTLLSIPREAMDKRAVDAGDIQFFELAYLETEVKTSKNGHQIKLTDFVIPNLDLVPAEVKKLVKKWSDYIDYWSVDWDYKNDTFHNQWQSYRTKKDRSLELITDAHEYSRKGDYKVMVKVIDIFGNDTTHIIELKHR